MKQAQKIDSDWSKFFKGDAYLLIITFIPLLLSIPIVYSSIGPLTYKITSGSPENPLVKRIIFISLSLFVGYIAYRVKYHKFYKKEMVWFFWGGAVFLMLITYLIAPSVNRAQRSITIPLIFTRLSFVTSDFARLVVIYFSAFILSKYIDRIKESIFILKKLAIPIGMLFVLIFPQSLSTGLILFVTFVLMIFCAGFSKRFLVKYGLIFAFAFSLIVGGMYLFDVARAKTWVGRVEQYIGVKDEDKTLPINYKPTQSDYSKLAIRSGKVFGEGPGNSLQRISLSQAHTDFIFAIITEEYGLFGAIILMLLFAIFAYRCVLIINQLNDSFGQLLVLGFMANILFQVFINILVSVNLIPVTGEALPFVSKGGSSLIFFAFCVGVILNISRYAK